MSRHSCSDVSIRRPMDSWKWTSCNSNAKNHLLFGNYALSNVTCIVLIKLGYNGWNSVVEFQTHKLDDGWPESIEEHSHTCMYDFQHKREGMESCVQSWRPRMCPKYCVCHYKWSQGLRSAAPVVRNHLSKPEDLMLQSATPLRKSGRWLMCVSYCSWHAKCIFANPLRLSHTCHAKRYLKVQARSGHVIDVLNPSDLDTFFAPQWHESVPYMKIHEVICAFWLPNVFHAKTCALVQHLNFLKVITPNMKCFAHFEFDNVP